MFLHVLFFFLAISGPAGVDDGPWQEANAGAAGRRRHCCPAASQGGYRWRSSRGRRPASGPGQNEAAQCLLIAGGIVRTIRFGLWCVKIM